MNTYTFYPKDNSEIQRNVTAPEGLKPDGFGCIEIETGVYVPTPDQSIINAIDAANPGYQGPVFGFE